MQQQQPARELTPFEVAEGERGIHDRDLTATQIQALVRQMDQSKKRWAHLKNRDKPAYLAHLKTENENLFFNYPGIWDMHSEDRLDATFFEMMMMKRKIEKGELTKEQASAAIGQKLFSRFIPHVISNAPAPSQQMSYEDYYKQFGELG